MKYYYPEPGSTSKATWVLDAIAKGSKSDNDAGVFWGLANDNYNLIKNSQKPFYFTDMPYWNRWMGNNRDTCSWRIIPNKLHCNWVENLPNDRFKKLGITVKDWRTKGDHILVCPSSISMNRFYDRPNWLNETVDKLKEHTDRPIRIRHKPRNAKTSGPLAATIPFEDDIKDAWAVVTLTSIAGVEAACLGIPVFCDKVAPCAQLGNIDLSNIENPLLLDRNLWLNTLSYYQYTEGEMRGGIINDYILHKQ